MALAKYFATERAWRARRKAQGYCGQCWGRKANTGAGATRVLCGRCARRMRAWRAAKRAEGKCSHCLKSPAANGPGSTKTLCARCAERSRRRSRGTLVHQESVARVEQLMALAAML